MKFFKPTLVAIALVSIIGCQEKAVVAEEKAPVLETQIQKQGYALGASIGMYMERQLEEQDKMGLALEKELILKGFTDSLAGKSLIEQEEIQSLLMALDQSTKAKQQELAIAAAANSLAEGQKFLEENAKKEGVTVTESGLQYSVITASEGDKPAAIDTVKVHYKGTFIDGKTFQSSYDSGTPVEFSLNSVIPGWTEGVQLMSVGSKFKFTIPAELAYGPNGKPPMIAGNSVLEFEIELLEIQKAEAQKELADNVKVGG